MMAVDKYGWLLMHCEVAFYMIRAFVNRSLPNKRQVIVGVDACLFQTLAVIDLFGCVLDGPHVNLLAVLLFRHYPSRHLGLILLAFLPFLLCCRRRGDLNLNA